MAKDNFLVESNNLQQAMLELERQREKTVYNRQQEIDSMKKKISACQVEERSLNEEVQKLMEEVEANTEL